MQTVSSLLDRSQTMDATKRDINETLNETWMGFSGQLFINDPADGGATGYTPDRWSEGQLFDRVGLKYARQFFWNNPGVTDEEKGRIINDHLDGNDKQVLFRTDGGRLRAVMSDRYYPIDNSFILGVAEDFIEPMQHIVTPDSVLSADEMHVKIIMHSRDTEDGPYGYGAFISNRETGGGAVKVYPLIMRSSCTNSIIRVNEEFRLVHLLRRDYSKEYIEAWLLQHLSIAFNTGTDMIAQAIAARNRRLPRLQDLIKEVKDTNDLGDEFTYHAAIGSQHDGDTLAGFINGITYAAQHAPMETGTRFNIEALAGSALGLQVDGGQLAAELFSMVNRHRVVYVEDTED